MDEGGREGGRGHFGWNVASLWSRLLARLDRTAGQCWPSALERRSINKGYIDGQKRAKKARDKTFKKADSQGTFKTRESTQPGSLQPCCLVSTLWNLAGWHFLQTARTWREGGLDGGRVQRGSLCIETGRISQLRVGLRRWMVQGRKGNRGSSEKKYRLDGKYEGRNFRPMWKRKGEVKGRVSGQTGKVKERKKVDCWPLQTMRGKLINKKHGRRERWWVSCTLHKCSYG